MRKQKNARSLDAITDIIHKLERGNIIAIGDLLLEARGQCEHGGWLDWLSAEFQWSTNTAQRYMAVAELATKFPKLSNLKLGSTTFYDLADHHDEEDLPAIIEELAKHAAKERLRPSVAKRVMMVGIGRRHFGDHPDATLVQLAHVKGFVGIFAWAEKAIAMLIKQKPETDEAAALIVDTVKQKHEKAVRKSREAELQEQQKLLKQALETEAEEEQREADDILDGDPPKLPPPTTSESQKLGGGDEELYRDAVNLLARLSTKPMGKFIGMAPIAEVSNAVGFLSAIAAAEAHALKRNDVGLTGGLAQ